MARPDFGALGSRDIPSDDGYDSFRHEFTLAVITSPKFLTIARSRCPDVLDATQRSRISARSDLIRATFMGIVVRSKRTPSQRQVIAAQWKRIAGQWKRIAPAKRSDPCQSPADALAIAADGLPGASGRPRDVRGSLPEPPRAEAERLRRVSPKRSEGKTDTKNRGRTGPARSHGFRFAALVRSVFNSSASTPRSIPGGREYGGSWHPGGRSLDLDLAPGAVGLLVGREVAGSWHRARTSPTICS